MLTNKNKRKRTKQKTERRSKTVSNFFSKEDPFGSYTGTPENINDVPVQDVDDL